MGNMAGKTRADLAKELDDLAEELTEEGMPSEMSVEIQYTIKINFHSPVFSTVISTQSSSFEIDIPIFLSLPYFIAFSMIFCNTSSKRSVSAFTRKF